MAKDRDAGAEGGGRQQHMNSPPEVIMPSMGHGQPTPLANAGSAASAASGAGTEAPPGESAAASSATASGKHAAAPMDPPLQDDDPLWALHQPATHMDPR